MDTNAAFLAYAREKFDVKLQPSPVWTAVGQLDLNTRARQEFVKDFVRAYPTLLEAYPELKEVARPLLFAIVKYGAAQPSTMHWWTDVIANVIQLWTRHGTKDMSQHEAAALTPLLRERLQYGRQSENKISDMLYVSATLWAHLGKEILHIFSERAQKTNESAFMLPALVHRYHPQNIALNATDTVNSYGKMCGWFEAVKPTAAEMATILMPNHHNTVAWDMALKTCSLPPTGMWMDLAPALSSLPLSPDDTLAWDIMARLYERAATDASCEQLVGTLYANNPAMAQAYTNLWPTVSVMYDAEHRSAAAVQLWTHPVQDRPEAIELPGLALD